MKYGFPTDTAIVAAPRETFRQSFIEEAVPDGRHPSNVLNGLGYSWTREHSPVKPQKPQRKTDVNGRAGTDSRIVGRQYLFIGIQGGREGIILRIERLW